MNTATQERTEPPLVSVIVPVYNTAPWLRKCLDSIINQTYRNLEIICVNDGSTDGSAEILEEYAAKDSRVKVIHQENAGVAVARNRGMAMAKGDVIGFCDSDDAYASGALQYVADLYKKYSFQVLVTGFSRVAENGERSRVCIEESEVCTARQLQEKMLCDSRIMGSVWNKFFAASLIKEVAFDTHLTHCEDMHFVSQVLSREPEMPVLISPCITYEYYSNAASATVNPALLLDAQGRLRYLTALEAILRLYPRDWQMWCLARSAQFNLVVDNLCRFSGEPALVRKLAGAAIAYAPAHVLCRRRAPLRARWAKVWHVVRCMLTGNAHV